MYFVLNLLPNGVSDVFPYACTLCLPLTIAFALLDYKQGVLVMNMTPLEINCVLYTQQGRCACACAIGMSHQLCSSTLRSNWQALVLFWFHPCITCFRLNYCLISGVVTYFNFVDYISLFMLMLIYFCSEPIVIIIQCWIHWYWLLIDNYWESQVTRLLCQPWLAYVEENSGLFCYDYFF